MLSVALIPFNYSYFSLCSDLWFLAQKLKEIYIVCFIKSIWNNHTCFIIPFKLSRWRWLSIWDLDSGWLFKCYSIYGLVCIIDKRKIKCFKLGQMILFLQRVLLCAMFLPWAFEKYLEFYLKSCVYLHVLCIFLGLLSREFIKYSRGSIPVNVCKSLW